MAVIREPLAEEPIAGTETVEQYDKGARLYMMPEYRYFVRKIIKSGIMGGKVLDIGTGTGWLAIELAKAKGCNFRITALDISENMLAKARENAGENGVANRIEFVHASAASMPFPDRSFDLTISYASLHHWLRPVEVFNEAGRVTGIAGAIILRDNQRVYGNPFWDFAIWLATRFMNRQHRKNWRRAILASYTVPEVKELLSKSNLKDYQVSGDFLRFDLCIQKKPAKSA